MNYKTTHSKLYCYYPRRKAVIKSSGSFVKPYSVFISGEDLPRRYDNIHKLSDLIINNPRGLRFSMGEKVREDLRNYFDDRRRRMRIWKE